MRSSGRGRSSCCDEAPRPPRQGFRSGCEPEVELDVLVRERRAVRRAGMVGGSTYGAGRSTRQEATLNRSQAGWMVELERLRGALTEDEFASARRHLLTAERGARG